MDDPNQIVMQIIDNAFVVLEPTPKEDELKELAI